MPFLIPVALGGTLTAAEAGTGMGIAGLASSVVGTVAAGREKAQGLRAEAAGADYNARVAAQKAEAARRAGGYAAKLLGEKDARIQGAARAAVGASGVTEAGSPLEVLSGNAFHMEEDLATEQYNTQVKAMGYQAEAGMDLFQGSQYREAAAFAAPQALVGAGTTLLGGGYKLLGGGYKLLGGGNELLSSYQ